MKNITVITLTGIAGLLVVGILLHIVGDVRSVTSSKRTTQRTMSQLQFVLRLYAQEFGALPKTTGNSAVLEILTGGNPDKASFYSITEAEHAAHQLLDGWDRPYVFERTTDNWIIRSAGGDGIYHTKDDLTLNALVPQATKAVAVDQRQGAP